MRMTFSGISPVTGVVTDKCSDACEVPIDRKYVTDEANYIGDYEKFSFVNENIPNSGGGWKLSEFTGRMIDETIHFLDKKSGEN